MPTEYDNDLLREGILRYRAREFDSARGFLQRAVDTADDLQTRAQANYYLSLLATDPAQKRSYLEETLAIDLTHAEARRALAMLDGKLKPADLVDPDAMPVRVPGTHDVQADRFTCPSCGGRMVFTPDGQSLVCESCGHNQSLSPAQPGREQDFFIAMANGSSQRLPVDMQTFQCQGCGASFVLAPQQLSATCAYCGSDHVVALQATRQLLEPDSILPMRFDQAQASRTLSDWVRAQKITLQAPVQPPVGLYLPAWSFDLFGSLPWKGLRVRNKRTEPVSGEQDVHFEDIRIPASQKLATLVQAALPGFDLPAATSYDPRFLAGWAAEVYDLPMAEASLEARRIAVERVRDSIHAELGRIQSLDYSTAALMVNAFKLVLVPVWVIHLQVDDRDARLLINGRTGSVVSGLSRAGVAGWVETIFTDR